MGNRLLIVDDDAEFLERICPALQAAGFESHAVSDGNTAIDYAKANSDSVAAAIVDLDLPGRSGFEVIREIALAFPKIPILAVTGIYKEFYLDVARNVGAHVARRKENAAGPLSGDEWVQAVREMLGD